MKMLGPPCADAACWNFDGASLGCSTMTLTPVSLVNFSPTLASPLYALSPLIQICSVPLSSARAGAAAISPARSVAPATPSERVSLNMGVYLPFGPRHGRE